MTERTIILEATNGMHARPAGELVKLARSLSPVKLSICSGGKCANATSMLSLLALGLKCGSELSVKAEAVTAEEQTEAVAAEKEAAALESICRFIAEIKD